MTVVFVDTDFQPRHALLFHASAEIVDGFALGFGHAAASRDVFPEILPEIIEKSRGSGDFGGHVSGDSEVADRGQARRM